MLRKLTVETSSCVCFFFIKYVNAAETLFLKILNNDIFFNGFKKVLRHIKKTSSGCLFLNYSRINLCTQTCMYIFVD